MAFQSFLSAIDVRLSEEFLENGYTIHPCEELDELKTFHENLLNETNQWLSNHGRAAGLLNLDLSHTAIPPEVVNDIRLHLFGQLNANQHARFRYFKLASSLIQSLVGNELVMQNKINISIQQPHDQTSVLELHSDVWNGDSPFQVVLWVPFTDCAGSNAMFLLAPAESREAYRRARAGELKSMADIHAAYRDRFKTIEVKFGEVLVFDSNCLHGNQLNTTSTSRWSMNCRVASLLAPATTPERRLGSYYTPIMVRAATRMGVQALEALGIVE